MTPVTLPDGSTVNVQGDDPREAAQAAHVYWVSRQAGPKPSRPESAAMGASNLLGWGPSVTGTAAKWAEQLGELAAGGGDAPGAQDIRLHAGKLTGRPGTQVRGDQFGRAVADNQRAMQARERAANPISYGAGEVAGSVPIMAAAGDTLAAVSPEAMQAYWALGPGARGALSGALPGAIQGAGGGGPEHRVSGTAIGAASGAGLGATVGKYVAPAAEGAFSWLSSDLPEAVKAIVQSARSGPVAPPPSAPLQTTMQDMRGSVQLPDFGAGAEGVLTGARERAAQAANGAQAYNALKPFGIEMTQGQAARSAEGQRFESQVLRGAYGDAPRDQLLHAVGRQPEQVQQAIAGLASPTGAPSITFPAQAGSALQQALSQRVGDAQAAEGAAWEAFRASPASLPGGMFASLGPQVRNALRDVSANLSLPAAAKIYPASKSLLDLVDQTIEQYAARPPTPPNPMTGFAGEAGIPARAAPMFEIDALHKAASAAVGNAQTAQDQFFALRIKQAIDQWTDHSVNAYAQSSTDPRLQAANALLKTARQQTADMQSRYFSNPVIAEITQGRGAMKAPLSDQNVVDSLLSNTPRSAQALAQLRQEFGAASPEFQGLREAFMGRVAHALDAAARKQTGEAPYQSTANQLSEMLEGGKLYPQARALLSPEQLANLKLLRDGIEHHLVPLPGAVNGSNTNNHLIGTVLGIMRGQQPMALAVNSHMPILSQAIDALNVNAVRGATTGFARQAAQAPATINDVLASPFQSWAPPLSALQGPAMLGLQQPRQDQR